MTLRLGWLVVVCGASLVLWSTRPVCAQAPTSPQPVQPVPAGPPAVEASPLETYYLRDSKGQLVPVPGFTYEEFEQLLRLQRGLAPPAPPNYTLDSLTVGGALNKGIADLQLVATVRVRDESWVRVPLALGGAILRQPARYEGPGEHVLAADAGTGGYLLWLKGTDAKPHVITLQLSAPTTQTAGESRLAISLPRATESSLRLTVPTGRAEASLLGGEGIVSVAARGESSEINVLGPSGDLLLAWQGGREPVAPGPALLEASGEIVVKVEGESRISSDARLRVRSLGGAIDTFRVRLPPGMELIPTSPAAYGVSLVPPEKPATGPGATSQMVEIKLSRPTSATTEIRLLAAVAPDAGRPAALAPARFDVISAVRQRGTIDCTVEGEWLLQWKEDGSTRRLDVGADAAAARLAARYEYSRQPCGLTLKVSTRPSRVSVEPTHVIYVDSRQVRIESTLKYRFRGARVTGLSFALADWKLDRLTPSELFDIVPQPSGGGNLTIPVQSGTALPTELELKLEAHRAFDPAGGELTIPLPHPLADVVAPALVVVAPADNLELTPQWSRIQGLSADAAATPLRIAGRQQSPLVYRDLGGGEPASFAANILVRQQSLTVGGLARVRLDGERLHVEQRLDYRIAYQPQRSFEILVPRDVLISGGLEVSLDGLPLTPASAENAADSGEQVRLVVVAPTDQIGQCRLLCQYTLPLDKLDREQEITLTLPLVIPADSPNLQIGGQQVEFDSFDGWQVEPQPGTSGEFSHPAATSTGGASPSFAWSRATPVSFWVLRAQESSRALPVTLGKAWVQTWLAGGVRQERAVFRLTTDQDELRIRLPGSPAAGSVQAAVNAQPAAVVVREPATLVIELPAAARGHESVVEAWYAMPGPAARGGLMTADLRPPQLEGGTAPRRMYWQLGLPEDEHLVLPPREFSAEMTWSRRNWLWGRHPTLGQENLEAWIGASRQDPLPQGAATYLFSSLGRNPPLALVVAQRRLLMFGASSLALVCGLLLLHLRVARRPEALLSAAVVLAALALIWPDTAILIAQAGAIGLVVTAVLVLGIWLTAGRSLWSPSAPAVFLSPPPESRSTEAPAGRSERMGPLTTATAPAAGLAAAEPQP